MCASGAQKRTGRCVCMYLCSHLHVHECKNVCTAPCMRECRALCTHCLCIRGYKCVHTCECVRVFTQASRQLCIARAWCARAYVPDIELAQVHFTPACVYARVHGWCGQYSVCTNVHV